MRWTVSVLALLVGIAGCAPDMATRQRRLEPHYRAQRPEGPGPFAAVLLVPGCGGITPDRLRTASELIGRGYATLFVDYLAARGLQTACRGEVTPDDIAADIRAARARVRDLAHVGEARVGAVGWSLGGAGVLASLRSRGDQPPVLDAAAAFYPPCNGVAPWSGSVPVLLLLGGRDDIAPLARCVEVARSVEGAASVVVRTYPDARHSFDSASLPPVAASRAFPGKTAGYHPEAARQAWSEVMALLDRYLRAAR